MLNWIITVLSFCMLLGGSYPASLNPCRVVTEITIEWNDENTTHSCRYTQQQKMNHVMNYLHSLNPIPGGGDPSQESTNATQYRIRILRSDGTVGSYTQHGITNFHKENEPWEYIDPEDAIRLPLILAAIPSDVYN